MKLTRILTTILLTIFINLSIINPSNALYTEDLTITGTNGIWTDVRSYNSLSDAIAAIGSKQQTLLIPLEVTCSDLTIPSNITLKFVKTGAINNSGTLTIQTINIIAGYNQIFTGSGSVNFADNTEVKASWFSSLYNAINQTNNDKVCLTIDNQYTLSTSISLGNNTTLKFLPSTSAISANSGVTLSNISKVISSKDTIFTGDGDFDFVQGSVIHTSWFTSFRRAISYIDDDSVPVNLLLDSSGLLDADTTINNYINVKFIKGNPLNIPSGITLTLNGQIDAGDYQIFSGDGNIVFPDNSELKSNWFSSFETAIAKINSAKVNLIVTSPATISNNCTINNNISLSIPCPNRILTISSGKTLTINGPFFAGLYQVFGGEGEINITGSVNAAWWGFLPENTEENNNAALVKALTQKREVNINQGDYYTTPITLLSDASDCSLIGHGRVNIYASTGTACLTLGDAEHTHAVRRMVIKNLYLYGSGPLTYGLNLQYATDLAVYNLNIIDINNIETNIYINYSWDNYFYNTQLDGKNGIKSGYDNPNNNNFFGGRFHSQDNTLYTGINFFGVGNCFHGVDISNYKYGVIQQGCKANSFISCYFESNGTNDINMIEGVGNSSGVIVQGCSFLGIGGTTAIEGAGGGVGQYAWNILGNCFHNYNIGIDIDHNMYFFNISGNFFDGVGVKIKGSSARKSLICDGDNFYNSSEINYTNDGTSFSYRINKGGASGTVTIDTVSNLTKGRPAYVIIDGIGRNASDDTKSFKISATVNENGTLEYNSIIENNAGISAVQIVDGNLQVTNLIYSNWVFFIESNTFLD